MRALLVIDMQVGCFAGEPPRRDQAGTVARINQLAQVIRLRGMVVFVQHAEPTDGFSSGGAAWELLPTLDRQPGDLFSEKTGCDAFLETDLHGRLRARGVTDLVITGCATDFCVDTTVRAAAALRYRVTVAKDAHTTRDRPHLDAAKIIEHHNYMWAGLQLPRQAKVRVVETATVLAQLCAP